MNFLLVNVTFLEVVIIIYDAIITANPYPNTANLLEIIKEKKKKKSDVGRQFFALGISMGGCNTIVSAYTLYRHLQ